LQEFLVRVGLDPPGLFGDGHPCGRRRGRTRGVDDPCRGHRENLPNPMVRQVSVGELRFISLDPSMNSRARLGSRKIFQKEKRGHVIVLCVGAQYALTILKNQGWKAGKASETREVDGSERSASNHVPMAGFCHLTPIPNSPWRADQTLPLSSPRFAP